jgi:hypothetical protein
LSRGWIREQLLAEHPKAKIATFEPYHKEPSSKPSPMKSSFQGFLLIKSAVALILLNVPSSLSAQTIADGDDNPSGITFTPSAADRETEVDYPAGNWTYDTTTT